MPADFPSSPKDLLGKAEAPKPMSKEALRAMLRLQGFNPPTGPAAPPEETP